MKEYSDTHCLPGDVSGMAISAFVDDSRLKRVFDIFFAGLAVIVTLPLMVLIALAVMAVSGGAPIYAHRRVGLDGRAFGCLKFRSMVRDADTALQELLQNDPEAAREWKAQHKLREDPRILPIIGHFLRRSSLDELPQFFNVLMGDMSIVGPRPVVQDELEKYGTAKNMYLSIRPGLTGPWQVGNRSNDTYENRVKLDVEYIANRSMTVDIGIVASTARMFLRGRSPGAF